MTNEATITCVSDTALWVASLRAREGARAHTVYHDPLAAALAGERGRKIARSMSRSTWVAWGLVIRTSIIDLLITEVLQTGVDTVLNLGAGLDTRPYRLKLPAHIRWVEIDLPNIVELKNSTLAAHKPTCMVERVGMDLSDRSARNAIFARYGAASKNTLLIAEGVIPYFSNEDVANLARDLHAIRSFRQWILDFDNAGKRSTPRGWAKKLQAAPFLFQVPDWFKFFEQSGWRSRKIITSAEESERIDRPFPFDFPFGLIMHAFPKEVTRRVLSLSGAVLMEPS
jgi:methyltransferase (TIGR00027 family)